MKKITYQEVVNILRPVLAHKNQHKRFWKRELLASVYNFARQDYLHKKSCVNQETVIVADMRPNGDPHLGKRALKIPRGTLETINHHNVGKPGSTADCATMNKGRVKGLPELSTCYAYVTCLLRRQRPFYVNIFILQYPVHPSPPSDNCPCASSYAHVITLYTESPAQANNIRASGVAYASLMAIADTEVVLPNRIHPCDSNDGRPAVRRETIESRLGTNPMAPVV